MNVIKKDENGLYVAAGGICARVFTKTKFKEGNRVATHHFGGTIFVGVGKNSSCKRGQYLEKWVTTQKEDDRLIIAWYKEEARGRLGLLSNPKDKILADKYLVQRDLLLNLPF